MGWTTARSGRRALAAALLAVGALALPGAPAAQDADGEDGEEIRDDAAVVRRAWLDEQIAFALRLAEMSWGDLADQVVADAKRGDPRVDQAAPTGGELIALRRAEVRLRSLAAERVGDLRERRRQGEAAIGQMREIVDALDKAMVERYTALNRAITEIRRQNQGEVPDTPAARDRIGKLNAEAVDAREMHEEARRDLAVIYLDLARAFARDGGRAGKADDRVYARVTAFEWYEACLGEEEAVGLAAANTLADRHMLLHNRLFGARRAAARERAARDLRGLLVTRARYNHKVEEAFAAWATFINRNVEPGVEAAYGKILTERLAAENAKLKEITEQEKAAGNNAALKRRLADEKREVNARKVRREGESRVGVAGLAARVWDLGSGFYDTAESTYGMMPDDRQIYWHWMKFLAAYDDALFVEDADDEPNALGRRPGECERCHAHPDQRHPEKYEGIFLASRFDREKRRFFASGTGRQLLPDGETRTAKKVFNDELKVNEDVVEVVWNYTARCTVCHLHQARYNLDVLDNPDRVPGDRDAVERPLTFYNRNSDRARYLFLRQFGWDRVAYVDENGRRRQERNDDLDPYFRALGLYAYVEAVASLAEGALHRAAVEKDAGRKEDWRKHAAELVATVDNALTDLMAPRPALFGGRVAVDASLRARARLDVAVPWHLVRARLAKAAGDAAGAEAEVHFKRALRESTLAQLDGGPAWRRRAQEAVSRVTADARAVLGRELEQTGDVVLARADEAYTAFAKLIRGTPERRAAAKDIRALYLEALAAFNGLPYGPARYMQVPVVLYRIADAALAREDYATAYLMFFQLAQEFNARQYPPERAPADIRPLVDRLVAASVANLPGAAQRLARALDDPEILIEGLRMAIAAAPEPPQDRIAQYGQELKKVGRADEALEVIGRVGPDSPYYGLMQLAAAEIHRDRLAAANARAADAALPDAARATARGEADAAFADLRAGVDRFLAAVNLDARPPRPGEDMPAARRVYDMYTVRIPGAMLLPIAGLYGLGRYEDVVKGADDLAAALAKLGDQLDAGLRKQAAAAALYYRFLAFYDRIDAAAPFADRRRAVEAADAAMNALADVDPDGPQAEQAYQRVGAQWLALADAARAAGDEAAAADLRLRAAVTNSKAARLVYQQMTAALRTAAAFVESEQYGDAVAVFTKAIDYWNDGLFNADYVLPPGREAKDFPAASPAAPAPAAAFGAVAQAASWPGTAGIDPTPAALAGRLNEFVTAADWPKLRAPVAAFVRAAAPVYAQAAAAAGAEAGAKALAAKLAAAGRTLARDDLDQQEAMRRRLLRTVLEAAYPDWLPVAPEVANLPSPAQFGEALRGFIERYPPNPSARRKAAFLLAMHDDAAVLGDADKRAVAERRAELAGILEGDDDAAKPAARRESALYNPTLKTLLYGRERAGRLRERSYPRARLHIRQLRDFQQRGMPLGEGRDAPALPSEAFLEEVEKALRFESELLVARRRYAEALVHVGGRENETRALAVLDGLIEYYPDDPILLAAVSRAEAQVAHNLATASPAGYGPEAARHYLRARYRAQYQLRDRQAPQGDGWWDATRLLQENALAEIAVRRQQGKDDIGTIVEQFEAVLPNGQLARYRIGVDRLATQVDKLYAEVARLRRLVDPDGPLAAARTEWLDHVETELGRLGFKPKELPKLELSL